MSNYRFSINGICLLELSAGKNSAIKICGWGNEMNENVALDINHLCNGKASFEVWIN